MINKSVSADQSSVGKGEGNDSKVRRAVVPTAMRRVAWGRASNVVRGT
jgi:hypothetical protein